MVRNTFETFLRVFNQKETIYLNSPIYSNNYDKHGCFMNAFVLAVGENNTDKATYDLGTPIFNRVISGISATCLLVLMLIHFSQIMLVFLQSFNQCSFFFSIKGDPFYSFFKQLQRFVVPSEHSNNRIIRTFVLLLLVIYPTDSINEVQTRKSRPNILSNFPYSLFLMFVLFTFFMSWEKLAIFGRRARDVRFLSYLTNNIYQIIFCIGKSHIY